MLYPILACSSNSCKIIDTFVEIDHVKGKIIDGNICVKNGVIHKVDTVLGYTSSTIMEVINRNPNLQ